MVQPKAKSNSIVTHSVVWENEAGEFAPVITFNVLGVGAVQFDCAKASEKNNQRAMVHGWCQRLPDGAAKSRDPKTGLPATPETKFEAIKRLRDHYEAGGDEWTMKSAPGSRGPDAGLILTAMCRSVAKGSIEEANRLIEALAAKRGIDRNESLWIWGKTAQVLEAIGQIKAERAPKGAADLMAELMAEPSVE